MATDELRKYYNKLKIPLKELAYSNYSLENVFQCHIVAAYSKCFEFNLLVNKKSGLINSFFFTPALRGICEDLITLNFLKKKKALDKNKLLHSYTLLQLGEIVEVQTKFFAKNHKQQIIFSFDDAKRTIEDNLKALKQEWSKIQLNKDRKFPTVAHMANDAGFAELYEYLYSATSDMVHFSPHNLMRSGWSEKKEPFRHYFNTNNFWKYYSLFNKFYGGYLFLLFSKTFKKELNIPKDVMLIIKDIESELSLESRWPELVTFEEMNVPEAESIRLINSIRKLKIMAKEMDISEAEVKSVTCQVMDSLTLNRNQK